MRETNGESERESERESEIEREREGHLETDTHVIKLRQERISLTE